MIFGKVLQYSEWKVKIRTKVLFWRIIMELQPFNKSYQDLINGYQLDESQLQFTGHPRECVKLLSTTRTPVLAMVEGKLVTYFDLHQHDGVAPYSDNDHAILVRAFSTEVHEQGKGYAKKALQLLPVYVKSNFPHINEIVLAVNIANTAAQKLYKKCGFTDYGVRRQGSKGELIVMSLFLD